jgi:hypothetical protein
MAKKQQHTAGRSVGAVLADVKEVAERLGHVGHFLRMAGQLFECIREDHPNLKAVAEHVERAWREADAAYNGTGES